MVTDAAARVGAAAVRQASASRTASRPRAWLRMLVRAGPRCKQPFMRSDPPRSRRRLADEGGANAGVDLRGKRSVLDRRDGSGFGDVLTARGDLEQHPGGLPEVDRAAV